MLKKEYSFIIYQYYKIILVTIYNSVKISIRYVYLKPYNSMLTNYHKK